VLIDGSVQFMCCGQALRHRFIDHDNFARDKERERERDRQTDSRCARVVHTSRHADDTRTVLQVLLTSLTAAWCV